MTQQLDLFPPAPPLSAPAEGEQRRLSRQCAAIIERLRRGPATNGELILIAQRFGARVKELRDAGYVIDIIEHNHDTGRVIYKLRSEPNG